MATIILAIIGGIATIAWDVYQRKKGLESQIESVGLKERNRADLESNKAEVEILQSQQDASKQSGPVTGKDFAV